MNILVGLIGIAMGVVLIFVASAVYALSNQVTGDQTPYTVFIVFSALCSLTAFGAAVVSFSS